jgi:hypothetical protein
MRLLIRSLPTTYVGRGSLERIEKEGELVLLRFLPLDPPSSPLSFPSPLSLSKEKRGRENGRLLLINLIFHVLLSLSQPPYIHTYIHMYMNGFWIGTSSPFSTPLPDITQVFLSA